MKKLGIKTWIWLILILISLLSIFVSSNGFTILQKGVLVTSVEANSTAFDQGFRQGQIITSIDNVKIENLSDFSNYLQGKFLNGNTKMVFQTKGSEIIYYSSSAPEITVAQIPKTSIKTGLDLSGGARALIKAKGQELNSEEISDLVSITTNRLNVYGLSDVKVSPVRDLDGNYFMLIEIAGSTPKDLKDLIENQGKFEAKIGDEIVFIGGDKDIASVSNNAQESYVSCPTNDPVCSFQFGITLSPEAAKKFAKVTSNLSSNDSNPTYLEESLDLYVDDSLVSSLQISTGLKGQLETRISISGSESGATIEEAYDNAQAEMNRLKTVLITGSLPYQLEIVKLDTISPTLGNNFIKFIMLAGIAALIAASIVVFIRYRDFKSSIALVVVSFSEIIIILGIASLIDWNIDLAGIAGILATIGTGFDDQIVLLDESRNKTVMSLKQRLKRAFAIIMGAYFTALVSLLPLMWAGAGLLKGFAITTIIGISVGVFITRPAFGEIIKKIHKD